MPFYGEMQRDSFLLTVPALVFMHSAQTAIRQRVAQGQARLGTRKKHATFGEQPYTLRGTNTRHFSGPFP